MSKNWLLRTLSSVYVEVIRNVPLLLQLFMWYGVFLYSMPRINQSITFRDAVFINNRGFYFPWPVEHPGWTIAGFGLLVGLTSVFGIRSWAKRRQALTGQSFPLLGVGLGTVAACVALFWWLGGAPVDVEFPARKGLNFVGGGRVTPEFTALLIGLVSYTAAFIAENVRSGILAINSGQTEAAEALGLSRGKTLRLVILPQALRVIVPPTTSQYLNLTKNSSLAVAIGYPDLVFVGNTTLNQTGQAIEAIAIFMAVYLFISLAISLFMNWYNARIALKER